MQSVTLGLTLTHVHSSFKHLSVQLNCGSCKSFNAKLGAQVEHECNFMSPFSDAVSIQ